MSEVDGQRNIRLSGPIIVWASESVDITPKVIQRLNAAAQRSRSQPHRQFSRRPLWASKR
jgi:hypothetical protein